jgi:hypothetical protein
MKLSLLVLYATDIDRTREFYESLGMAFKQEQHGGPVHYASDIEGMVVEIYPAKQTPGKMTLDLQVDDLENACGQVSAIRDNYGWRTKDPDGRIVYLR